MFFDGWASNDQDLPKARPRVIFEWKNFIQQLKLLLKWMLIERWTRPSMLSSPCQHVARLQFDSCAEQDTVMIGLNWLRKRIVVQQSKESMSLHPCFRLRWFSAGLPRKAFSQKHAFVDISVFLWLHKQRLSFVQGQPKGYFQLKELHRATTGCKKYAQMNADRRAEKAQYAEFNVPICGGAVAKMWAF